MIAIKDAAKVLNKVAKKEGGKICNSKKKKQKQNTSNEIYYLFNYYKIINTNFVPEVHGNYRVVTPVMFRLGSFITAGSTFIIA